jgi:hypothetical protein
MCFLYSSSKHNKRTELTANSTNRSVSVKWKQCSAARTGFWNIIYSNPKFQMVYSVQVTVAEAEVKLQPRVRGPVSLGVGLPSETYDQIIFLSDNCGFLVVERSVIYSYNCFWALPEQSLWGPSPAELRPYFTVSSETPPTWRASSLYLYLRGTGWPSYTPGH